tara:strand:- start:2478 stop:2741 length:264 start_codon:yes stop_codon:yes gene_type:complete
MFKLIIFHILILIVPFLSLGIILALLGKYSELRIFYKKYGYWLLIIGLTISITLFYLNPIFSKSSRDSSYVPPYLEDGSIISGSTQE